MPELASWPRKYFQPGGGDANLFFKIHGRFDGEPAISRSRHRTAGVPKGCDLMSYGAGDAAHAIGLDGYLGDRLRHENPRLFAASTSSEQCLILRGDIDDPVNLDYLRDAIGVVTALLQHGGVSVFDPHQFKWWSPTEWTERIFAPAAAVPTHHVVIQVSGDWYHTRGMLKFGRPDLSIHGVTSALAPAVIDLINRFIELQAFGTVIPEGEAVRMQALPEGWSCRHRGSLEDPDFNNRHVEIGPA